MSSNNNTYEQRIVDPNYDRIKVWKECLIKQADLTSEMLEPVKWQATCRNWKKPIGLYFDRIDWIAETHPDFRQRLANGEVTKQGSLIESVWYFGRGVCIDPSEYSSYEKRPKNMIIRTATNVLKASELAEQKHVIDDSSLKEYVAYIINRREEELDKQIVKRYGVNPAAI